MPKKRPSTSVRRRELLKRLDDALAESVDTRRRLVNRLERDEPAGVARAPGDGDIAPEPGSSESE